MIRVIKGVLLAAVVSLPIGSIAGESTSSPFDNEEETIAQRGAVSVPARNHTLFAGGDTMLARWVHQAYYRRGGAWMFEAVRDLVEGADIALTNLECIVSTEGDFYEKGERRPFLYRARPETLDILTEAGFDVVTTANNHSLDYGPMALADQRELLEAVGIAAMGSGNNVDQAAAPVYVKTGDIIVAFIGMDSTMKPFAATEKTGGTFYTKPGTKVPRRLKKSIDTARKRADLVVFTPHWGANWTENASEERIQLARAIVDEGVDAILGHSSHQLHGIEIYRGKPIVYDMGSLFFDTIRKNRMRLSAGFVLAFDKGGFRKLAIHPFYLNSSQVGLAIGRQLDRIQDLMQKLTRELDPSIAFEQEGDALVVTFAPEEPLPARQAEPEQVHLSGSTRRLGDDLRDRDSNVVVDTPPKWTRGYSPVAFDHGITVLGYWHPEAVRSKNAFVSKVALRVEGPLEGRWESFIEARRRRDQNSFRWQHPISDGAWQSEIWKPRQTGIDQTLVRVKLDPGVYDLFWGIRKLRSDEVARPLEPTEEVLIDGKRVGVPEGMVSVGSIQVLEKGIPRGVAGLKWSGLLPPEVQRLSVETIPEARVP